ncbi:MAG: cardiolipin synthase [Bacteroidales bacterium]|nr:cardiolipin synthase [Bacteroidales bacterium]MDD3989074.1 cardiolipin synthase [Bacteroidales bacterium]MDD4638757.1 cardiolipin synthase [Bacteroidales bacterium]
MTVHESISLAFYLVYYVLAIAVSARIIYKKLDPVKSLSWVVVILLLPYLGLIIYFLFGQNFRKTKIYNRKGVMDERYRRLLSYNQMKQFRQYPDSIPAELKRYIKLVMLNLKGNRSIVGLNSEVELYFSGREALESMYESISDAKKHIHLQSYIIEDDHTGKRFRDLLIKKALDGIEVRIIYDDVGCWGLSKGFTDKLRNAGVEVLKFAPVRFLSPTSKINYRNHRKILVVDGITGFLGGVNIADRYYDGGNFEEWRDTHVKISGESVLALQSSFLLDRYFVIKQQFKRKRKYFPAINQLNIKLDEASAKYYSQIITSGPDSDWASIMQCYFLAISNARKNVYLITPYFTPNESLLNALKIAALGGVDVCIMIPEKSDTTLAYWSSMSYATELLEAGVKVFLFRRGFNHSKVISIDGEFCIIGSANFDNRSLDQNFEITSIIYSSEITAEVDRQFREDVERGKSLAGSKWAKRSRRNKIKESFARLLSPLL